MTDVIEVGPVTVAVDTSWAASSAAAAAAANATFSAALWAPPPSGDNTGVADTANLQTLINTAAPNGGLIRLRGGIYQFTNLTLPGLVHLKGSGVFATTLQRVGAGTGPFISTAQWATRNGQPSTAGSPANFGLHDLTIDANHVGDRATGYAVAIHGRNYTISNVTVINSPSVGLWSEYGPNGIPGEEFVEAAITNLRILNCDGTGTGPGSIRFRGPSDSLITNVITAAPDSTPANNITDWHVWFDLNAWNTILTNVHCWGNPGQGLRADVPVELNNPNLEPACTAGAMIALLINTGNVKYGVRVIGGTLFFAGADSLRSQSRGLVFGTPGNATYRHTISGLVIQDCSAGGVDFTYHDTGLSNMDILIVENPTTARVGGPILGSIPAAANVRILHDVGIGVPSVYSTENHGMTQLVVQSNRTVPAVTIQENYLGSSSEIFRVQNKYSGTYGGFPPVFRAATGYVALGTDASGVKIYYGAGSPNGTYIGTVGSLFLRTDGGASTTLYVKESGTGNTGWVAK